jgi:hypothetical protein
MGGRDLVGFNPPNPNHPAFYFVIETGGAIDPNI